MNKLLQPRTWSSGVITAILIVVLIIIAMGLYFFLMYYSTSTNEPSLSSFAVASIEIVNQSKSSVLSGQVYVASSQAEQIRGFQNTPSFGNCNDQSQNASTQCLGMIFVTTATQNLCFWMHDTPLPLQQIWISNNGTVLYIYQAQKNSNTSVCHTAMDVLETRPNASISLGNVVLLG
jgi:uncharacterized membrane protein (UPF0127 family)